MIETFENTQELQLDGSNKVSFPGFPYKFEALNEKILVSIDIFKSGYECKTCKGKRFVVTECSCVKKERPGFRYSLADLEEIKTAIGEKIAQVRYDLPCMECEGDREKQSKKETCPSCKGLGGLLVLPDTAKNLPSSGVVVSMGAVARARADYKIGDRVLFSPHAGTMIPTKAGLMFKYMDWYQIALRVEGADELGAFDFMIQAD